MSKTLALRVLFLSLLAIGMFVGAQYVGSTPITPEEPSKL
jgi:hypothetical protein